MGLPRPAFGFRDRRKAARFPAYLGGDWLAVRFVRIGPRTYG